MVKEKTLQQMQRRFDEASRLSDVGDYVNELKIRKKMVLEYPENSKFRLLLAQAFKHNDQPNSAEIEFREAVKLSPDWELASLGLFHILWDQNKRVEAMDELARFMKISYSQDYMDIVREINE